MKQLRFVFIMIIVCIPFVCISCSSDEENLPVAFETQNNSIKEAEEYQKLINYMEQINPLYNIKNKDVITRAKFFMDRIRINSKYNL